MRLTIAQFVLNMIDDFLSITIKGRSHLASYLYFRQHPTKTQLMRREAKRLGVELIELKVSKSSVEDLIGMPRRQ
jgi:hypothetical protein